MSRGILAVSLALLLTACATAPEEESALAQAREAYDELSGSQLVQGAAPTELFEAEQALNRAEEAESDSERQHQLYLAQQYMAVARASAERASVEQQMQALSDERERLRLAAREQEVSKLEAELAALEAERTDRGMMVKLDDVFFETDQATLAPGAESTLDKLAGILRDNPDQEVVIEGHTDSTGPDSYNMQLSQRRADSVQQQLLQRGVDSSQVQTRGYGETRPIASNASSGGRQLNRRVEIIFPNAR